LHPAFPQSFVTFWPRLSSIFRAIAIGDDDLGIPPYNGGLFDPASSPILGRVQLPDKVVAHVVFGLSHEPDDGSGHDPKYIIVSITLFLVGFLLVAFSTTFVLIALTETVASAEADVSATRYGGAENIRIAAIVIAPFELGNIERKILAADRLVL
jgi:hypothetical protein